MGNKTRKLHNAKSALQEISQAPEATLEFPFHSVDRITEIFGAEIPGYQAVLAALPDEFRNRRNPYSALASHIFFNGFTEAQMKSLEYRAPKREVASAQWAYIRTWLGSFEPRHEDKEAVCGWLFSLMLVECPSF